MRQDRLPRWCLQVYPQQKGSTATYQVPFSRVVYMEQADFREQDSKDFYGLAPGKAVMLRCIHPPPPPAGPLPPLNPVNSS